MYTLAQAPLTWNLQLQDSAENVSDILCWEKMRIPQL